MSGVALGAGRTLGPGQGLQNGNHVFLLLVSIAEWRVALKFH